MGQELEHVGGYCEVCQAETQHQRTVTWEDINHVLHAILAIFMCGLWLPVWCFIVVTTPGPSKGEWFCCLSMSYKMARGARRGMGSGNIYKS